MSESWLVVEREGALWALPRTEMDRLERGPAVALADGRRLQVDEICAVPRELKRHPISPWLRDLLRSPIAELALWEGRPVAVLATQTDLPDCFRDPNDPVQKEVS